MKIGLFGGAFNPVHNGHMAVARAALKEFCLDKLIFIPTGNAPHKKETTISRKDRLNMLLLATKGEEKMCVSDYELMQNKVCHSADTTEYFKSLYKEDELFFIIGDDSYTALDTWYEPERILKACTLLVFPRNGADVTLPAVSVPMEKIEVSSSDIREKIKMGKDCTNVLPKEVFNYIIKKNLYVE